MLDSTTTGILIRLSGEVTVGSAAQVKAELLAALASGGDILADLEQAEDVDLLAMQLFLAAAREATAQGHDFEVHISAAADSAARDIGFDGFPGVRQANSCPK